jgi:hypothetical protein
MSEKRGRPRKGIERVLADMTPMDLRIPNTTDYVLIDGVTHQDAREATLVTLSEYPARVQSAYRAYVDFMKLNAFEPSKARLMKFALEAIYPDLPGPDDPKGWTRTWQDAGLGFLSPYPLMRFDPEVLEEMQSEDFNA